MRARAKKTRKVETIAILDGMHPNEEFTSHVLEEAIKEPFMRSLREKGVLQIVKMPFKFSAHGRVALAKRYIEHLYRKDSVIKESVNELNEKKEEFFRKLSKTIDPSSMKEYHSKKGELMNLLDHKIEEDLARMDSIEDKELVEILKEIKDNRDYLREGGYNSLCKEKAGKKPDVVIQLHANPKDGLYRELVIVPEDLKKVLGKSIKEENLEPGKSEDIIMEWPIGYRRSREFEEALDLPGAKIKAMSMLAHPALENNFALALDVPILMDVLYKKGNNEDMNYKCKIMGYIGKTEHNPEKIEEGKELLIKVLQALVKKDR